MLFRSADECLVLTDEQGQAESIVCAIPYLRDRDVRRVEAGESIEDKDRKLIAGIREHYSAVCNLAEEQRQSNRDLPIIATGHLFAAGGQTTEGDGVRELYVGSLAHVGREIFPDGIDYLALGHLHVPQRLAGCDRLRYSGSPIPMGYGEADQQKQVLLVDFAGRKATVSERPVPRFQELVRISGTIEEILERLARLRELNSTAWVEIEYTGQEIIGDLRDRIDEQIAGSGLEIRRIKNRRIMERVIRQSQDEETLDDLDVKDVFDRCLESHQVTEEERTELRQLYGEVIQVLYDADARAE